IYSIIMCLRLFFIMCCFFFSSRRRHTRWPRDWSSDVCSSDLDQFEEYFHYHASATDSDVELARALSDQDGPAHFLIAVREDWLAALDRFKGRITRLFENYLRMQQIGRASCRERGVCCGGWVSD